MQNKSIDFMLSTITTYLFRDILKHVKLTGCIVEKLNDNYFGCKTTITFVHFGTLSNFLPLPENHVFDTCELNIVLSKLNMHCK